MNISDAVKQMVKESGKTYRLVAMSIGMPSTGGITVPIGRGNLTARTLCRIATACGYEVCLLKKSAQNQKKGIVIEGVDEH